MQFKMLKSNLYIIIFVLSVLDVSNPGLTQEIEATSSDPKILFNTYFGGNSSEFISYMKLDQEQNIIISGLTSSPDFPLQNAYDDVFKVDGFYFVGQKNYFLAKFSPDGHLVFSTFLGKLGGQDLNPFFIDQDGNIIVESYNNFDTSVVIAKFSPLGNLLFNTKFGGSGWEGSNSLVLDENDNIIVLGHTSSDDFPVLNAFDDSLEGDKDIFVSKFSSKGKLLFSTYLGGLEGEAARGDPILDSKGNILIVGDVNSINFPTTNGFDTTFGGGTTDMFITKISSNGTLLFSTYLGGFGDESEIRVVLDLEDNILISGVTSSSNFPTTTNALDSSLTKCVDETRRNCDVARDTFLTKLNPEGEILFSTLIGGDGPESSGIPKFDSQGNILIFGTTYSDKDFPVYNAFDTTFGDGNNPIGHNDIFLAKFKPDGTPVFSSYFGGSGWDNLQFTNIDETGDIFMSGSTNSKDFPLVNATNSTRPDSILQVSS